MTDYAARTHPGLKRSHNEDCYAAEPELGIYLVADGVGGHAHGEVASAIVKDTIISTLRQGKPLAEAIHNAHHAVLAAIDCDDRTLGMGSTVVVAQLRGNAYEIGWVGDSRAYLFDHTLTALTSDHTPVNAKLARGEISPEQAKVDPERNILSQSLGVSASIEPVPGVVSGRLDPGQQLLLCSDGLTDELTDRDIARIMAGAGSTQEQVERLVDAALAAGGRDNISVIVVGERASP